MAKDPLTGEPVPWNDLHKQYMDGSVENDLPMTRLSEMFNVNHFIVSQVNPHVLPFLAKDESLRENAELNSEAGPGWFRIITHLARDEALYRMTVLSDLGIFPTFLTKAIAVVKQNYFGNITIFPEIPYSSFPLMLSNPTPDFMLNACIGGERAAWPKLGRIRNHLAIELALDSAIRTMRARVAFCPTETDLTLNGGFVRTVATFDVGRGRGRRPNQRRSSSYTLDPGKVKEAATCHIGSCPVQDLEMTRRDSSSSEQSHGFVSLKDPRDMKDTHSPCRQSAIQSTYIGGGEFIVEPDKSKNPASPFPRRPGLLVHRASWGPSTHDYKVTTTEVGWQSHIRTHSRRSSSSSLWQRRPQSTDTIAQHLSSLGHDAPVVTKSMSPSRRSLEMTPSTAAGFGGS